MHLAKCDPQAESSFVCLSGMIYKHKILKLGQVMVLLIFSSNENLEDLETLGIYNFFSLILETTGSLRGVSASWR